MTAILVDIYKDTLYVFGDGRVMSSDTMVYTEKDDKILKYDDDNIFTMVGDATIMDALLELFETGKLTLDNVKNITGRGEFIWANNENIRVVDIDYDGDEKSVAKNGISTFKHKTLPAFFGSGTEPVSASYYALECQKATDEKEYLSRIRKAFKSASTRCITFGPLHQIETINLSKNNKGT